MKTGKFKTKCLNVVEDVKRTQRKIDSTPIGKKKAKAFGKLKGTIHIKGDIISPIDKEWDAYSSKSPTK